MMNWNSNDTKYIIKRIILYFIIAGIVFFAGQSCAKAMTVSSDNFNMASGHHTISNGTSYLELNNYNNNYFRNKGQGYFQFTLMFGNDTNSGNWPIKNIYLLTYDWGGLSGEYICSTGTFTSYIDSATYFVSTTVVCPVNLSNGNGIGGIFIERTSNSGNLQIWISDTATFINETETGSQDIINANNTATQNIINELQSQGNADRQAITNAIQNETTAINNQTTAINNQTTVINNQTEWFEEQHDPLIDTGFLDVMGDLITTNDSDVVRQFILIPFNLFVQIYNACTSNTCSPLTLGTLYGTTLTLPCINWTTLVGSAIANTIDIIFSACLIFGMYRMIKHMINKIFTLSSTITDECGVEVFN